ncbi:MAG: hypothetical protein JXM71_11765 [Spirochaetales bacterium]|nr:hypothetical protein [Spirochaetales bacterium]
MGVVAMIVGGLVLISIVAVMGDVLGKSQQARRGVDPGQIKALTERVEALEQEARERESRIAKLEGDVAFTTKLLEDRSQG